MPELRTSDAIYLSTWAGFMVHKVKPGTPGSFERTNAENKLINEMRYNSITGMIANIEKVKSKNEQFDDQFKITILESATKSKHALMLGYSGGTSFRLLTKLFMADLSKPVTIETSAVDHEGGKTSTHFFVKQDGVNMKALWSKDNKRGLPDLVKVKIKNKDVWDDTDQMAFVEKFLEEKIKTRFNMTASEPAPDGPQDDIEDQGESAPAPTQPAAAPKAASGLGRTAPINPAPSKKEEPAPAPVSTEEDLPDWLK